MKPRNEWLKTHTTTHYSYMEFWNGWTWYITHYKHHKKSLDREIGLIFLQLWDNNTSQNQSPIFGERKEENIHRNSYTVKIVWDVSDQTSCRQNICPKLYLFGLLLFPEKPWHLAVFGSLCILKLHIWNHTEDCNWLHYTKGKSGLVLQ